jgi:hypothetical protein
MQSLKNVYKAVVAKYRAAGFSAQDIAEAFQDETGK